jgi:hypothetical protein
MDLERAKQRILELLDANDGYLTAAIAEADGVLARDQAMASAAARALATESGITTGTETDAREWFPYSFMTRTA